MSERAEQIFNNVNRILSDLILKSSITEMLVEFSEELLVELRQVVESEANTPRKSGQHPNLLSMQRKESNQTILLSITKDAHFRDGEVEGEKKELTENSIRWSYKMGYCRARLTLKWI
jgi:hypothetical protein